MGSAHETAGWHALRYSEGRAKLPRLHLFRSWKIYLASCCYGFLLLVPAGFVLRGSEIDAAGQQGLQLGLFAVTQLILVPVFLRSFTWKSLSVTTAAVVFTNAAGYVLFVLQQA